MNHQSECAVADVIQTRPEHKAEVLSVCCEVIWPDGSTAGLHPVRQAGQLPTFLRAVHHGGRWMLFDLQHVIPRDIEDIKQAQARDQVGLVMYALRRTTNTAAAFLAKVDRHALDRWPGLPRPAATVKQMPAAIANAHSCHAAEAPRARAAA